MKKLVAVAVLAVVGIVIGGIVFFALLSREATPGANQPGQAGPEPVPQDFDSARFMGMFDVNDDGDVSREEFMNVFATGEFALAVEGEALSAEQTFSLLDANRNGTISAAELRRFSDSAWREFQKLAQESGLYAREWEGRNLALNGPRLRAFAQEAGADARDEVPFGGMWIDARYVSNWSEVREANGEVYEAFVTERDGRKFALRGVTNVVRVEYDPTVEAEVAAEVRKYLEEWAAPAAGNSIEGLEYGVWGNMAQGGGDVQTYEGFLRRETGHVQIAQFQPRVQVVGRDAEVTPLPDVPQNVYAAEIKELPLGDEEGNLQLARQCVVWGMHTEARMLYLRVLIFQPGNREALDYWGIDKQGDQYHPRKN